MSEDYEVGYGKPPVRTRFGQKDGNRRAHSRRSKNLKTDLLEEMAQRVTLKVAGKPTTMTQQRALIKSLAHSGMKGNDRAIARLLDLFVRIVGIDDSPDPKVDLAAEDQAILDSFLARKGTDDDA